MADSTNTTSYKKSNFGAAFFFLSKERKDALAHFYEFCRIVDDIVDEPNDNPLSELNFWREQLKTPTTPLAAALSADIKTFNIDLKDMYDIIDGMEMDLNKTVYNNFEDLKAYMYRAACAVGLVSIKIFGAQNERSKKYALALGYAVQMTNIIRDIYEDYAIGRVYIPKEHLEKFAVTDRDLRLKNYARLRPLLKFEAELAEDFYQKAAALMPKEDKKALFAARIMGCIYRKILCKIKSDGFAFESKVRLNKFEKLLAVLQAFI